MKRILCIFFIAALIFGAVSLTVSAAPSDSESSDVSSSTDEEQEETEESKNFLEKFFSRFDEISEKITVKKALLNSKKTMILARESIEAILKNEKNIFSSFPSQTVVNATYSIFLPLGILVFFISWCMSMGDKALNGTLFDEGNGGRKHILISLAQLFGGIIFTAVGAKILQMIDAIVQIFTLRTLGNTDFYAMQAFIDKIDYDDSYTSKIPIIGPIITFFNELIGSLEFQIVGIVMTVCLCVILVTLAVRMIKLAIFKGTSPIFFAMATSDNLKRYTQNFVIRYCILAGQILIISILYSALEITIVSLIASYNNAEFGLSAVTTGGLLCIVFAILIARSDKLFDRVFVS